MEITLLNWLLSAAPIIIFLIVMLGFKWGGSKAGALCWLITVIIAVIFFGANFELIGYSYVKAFLLSIDVLLIIWTALFLFILTEQAGTIKTIGEWLSKLTQNRALQGIFLGWLFPSFLQGMGGFGVPVAVAAPLLVSTGFNPIQALVMASIGHAWSVTFGSMASSFQSMMAITNLPGEVLAPSLAVLLGIAAVVSGFLVTYVADGIQGIKSTFFLTLILGVILASGEYLLATNGLYILAVTIPALVALIFSYFLIADQNRNKTTDFSSNKRLLISFLPYIVLVVLTLAFNLIAPLKSALGKYFLSLKFPEITTSLGDITAAGPGRDIKLLNHPGTIIFLSGLISYFVFIKVGFLQKKDFKEILKKTAKKSTDTTIAIFTMVGIAVIMSQTQMTNILAVGISGAFNQNLFPFVSPFIGAIGAFITGSNSNSNVLFAALQMRTAELLGLSVPLILAAQSTGGALGSMMAPAKVILGCATVGLGGKEGEVISKILVYGMALVALIGIITLIFSNLGTFNAS
ncbi:MAG: L-lactate permease [Anaerolineaceae bacterium]|nr:L-lactate permease [Anaerolineaceae bacterium]